MLYQCLLLACRSFHLVGSTNLICEGLPKSAIYQSDNPPWIFWCASVILTTKMSVILKEVKVKVKVKGTALAYLA